MQLKSIFIVLFVAASTLDGAPSTTLTPATTTTPTPTPAPTPAPTPTPTPSPTPALTPSPTPTPTPTPTPAPTPAPTSTPTPTPTPAPTPALTPSPTPTPTSTPTPTPIGISTTISNIPSKPTTSVSTTPHFMGTFVHRCSNDTFDTLMCLPGTVVSITGINITVSDNTDTFHQSHGHCTVEWPADRDFSARARTSCDGRLTCDNLRADVNKMRCNGSTTEVDVSCVTINYMCINSTINADFRHAIGCSGENFNGSFCQGAGTIEVTNVYKGSTDESNCTLATGIGLCRLRNNSDQAIAYRQQCNGNEVCLNTTSVREANTFTLLEYRCTGTSNNSTVGYTPNVTSTTQYPPTPSHVPSPSPSSSVPTSTSVLATSPSTAVQTTGTSDGTSSDDHVETTINAEAASKRNRNRNLTDIAIAVPVAVVILVVVIILVVCLIRRRKREKYIWGESEVSADGEHLTHGSNRANSGGWNSEINGGYDLSATSSPTHSSHPDLVPTNSMTRPSSVASKRNTTNKNSYRKTMDVIVEYQPEGPLPVVEPRPSFSIAMGSSPRGYITDEPVRNTVQEEESTPEVDKTAIPVTFTVSSATGSGATESHLKPSLSISMGSDSHGYSEVKPMSATKLETEYIADSTTPGSQDVTPGAKVNPPDVPRSNTPGVMTEERGAISNIHSEVRKPEDEQPKASGTALYSEVDNGIGNSDTRYRPTNDSDIYSEVRDPTKSVVERDTYSDAPKNVDTPANGEAPDQGANNVYSEVRKPKHTSPDGDIADDTSGGIEHQEDTSANIYSEVPKPNRSQSDGIAAEINDVKEISEISAGDENPEDTSPIYSGDGQPPILPARQYTDDLTQVGGLPEISNDGNENSKPEQTSMDEGSDASGGTKLAENLDQNNDPADTTNMDASVSKQEQPNGHSVTTNNTTD